MSLKIQYQQNVRPALQETLGLKNTWSVPRLVKVTLNVGLNKDAKDNALFETAEKTLIQITGQKPVTTIAKKSISNFKIREGMTIGLKVTLRGQKMYDFMEKLVSVALPRIRDFRGLSPKSVDKTGNLTIGFKEHLAFPEINPGEIDRLHGLEVSITTTADNRVAGLALFKALGFPLRDEIVK